MVKEETTTATMPSWIERLRMALVRDPQNKEQLLAIIKEAEQRDIIDADALKMIEKVLQVATLRARDIMVPRSQMVVLEQDASINEILPIVVSSGHSRFPVIGDSRDKVIGILLAKDLLPYSFKINSQPLHLSSLMRPAFFIPESKRLTILLHEFRVNHNHMALIVDEYGGTAGLVTIEDVLEEIVGEIEDEYDIDEDPNIKKERDNYYLVKALTPIEEFNEFFHVSFSEQEFDTIGGLVMNKFGYLPKRGEKITISSLQFKVINADKRRIRLLRVSNMLSK